MGDPHNYRLLPFLGDLAPRAVYRDFVKYLPTDVDDTDLQIAELIPTHELPWKLKCSRCGELALNAVWTPCCHESVCECCSMLPVLPADTCPTCGDDLFQDGYYFPNRKLRKLVHEYVAHRAGQLVNDEAPSMLSPQFPDARLSALLDTSSLQSRFQQMDLRLLEERSRSEHLRKLKPRSFMESSRSDKVAQPWVADTDQDEITLEELAAATLVQDFKDGMRAIEQRFEDARQHLRRVKTERADRVSALQLYQSTKRSEAPASLFHSEHQAVQPTRFKILSRPIDSRIPSPDFAGSSRESPAESTTRRCDPSLAQDDPTVSGAADSIADLQCDKESSPTLLTLPQEIEDVIFDYAYPTVNGLQFVTRKQWDTREIERNRRNRKNFTPRPFPDPQVSKFCISKKFFVAASRAYIGNQTFEGVNGFWLWKFFGVVRQFLRTLAGDQHWARDAGDLPNVKTMILHISHEAFTCLEPAKLAWEDDLDDDDLRKVITECRLEACCRAPVLDLRPESCPYARTDFQQAKFVSNVERLAQAMRKVTSGSSSSTTAGRSSTNSLYGQPPSVPLYDGSKVYWNATSLPNEPTPTRSLSADVQHRIALAGICRRRNSPIPIYDSPAHHYGQQHDLPFCSF
jgi:hypothetical protein